MIRDPGLFVGLMSLNAFRVCPNVLLMLMFPVLFGTRKKFVIEHIQRLRAELIRLPLPILIRFTTLRSVKEDLTALRRPDDLADAGVCAVYPRSGLTLPVRPSSLPTCAPQGECGPVERIAVAGRIHCP